MPQAWTACRGSDAVTAVAMSAAMPPRKHHVDGWLGP